MGHPSSRVVYLIYEVDSIGRNDGVKNKFCDICLELNKPEKCSFLVIIKLKNVLT